jgi:hypothetical protein
MLIDSDDKGKGRGKREKGREKAYAAKKSPAPQIGGTGLGRICRRA